MARGLPRWGELSMDRVSRVVSLGERKLLVKEFVHLRVPGPATRDSRWSGLVMDDVGVPPGRYQPPRPNGRAQGGELAP
jgi:hypothetical protein